MKANSTLISRIAQRAKRPGGFTLIELLVVVAIIAILVAITVPALNGARNQAIGAKTLSRMRTLGAGYLLYMADNNTVPLNTNPTPNNRDSAGEMALQTAVASYLDLPETGNQIYASKVWWHGFAEINGYRTTDNIGGALYWATRFVAPGVPGNRKTGFDYNDNAFTTYTDASGKLQEGFTRLNQIAKLSKTALIYSRRQDPGNVWNDWSDGRKFSASNPPSYGAKRWIVYFDNHTEIQILTSSNFNPTAMGSNNFLNFK